jgi:hypothetical protein
LALPKNIFSSQIGQPSLKLVIVYESRLVVFLEFHEEVPLLAVKLNLILLTPLLHKHRDVSILSETTLL